MARMLGGVALAGAVLGSLPLQAADYTGPNVDEFIAEMTRDYGFVGEQLRDLFKQAERKQAILDAISRPAERVKPWKEYRPIFLTDSRIAQCVDFWRENGNNNWKNYTKNLPSTWQLFLLIAMHGKR